jgi:hypothetical protein
MAFIASSHAYVGSGINDLTADKPSGTLEGHLMVAALFYYSPTGISSEPAGWTQIGQADDSNADRLRMYYKVAGASEPATYTWTFAAGTYHAVVIATYDGMDAAPLDVSVVQYNGDSSAVSAASLTTTVNGALLIFAGGSSALSGSISASAPSGFTEREDYYNTYRWLYIADNVQASAGASGGVSTTITVSSLNMGALVAFKPAAAPSSGITAASSLAFNSVNAFDTTTGGPTGPTGYAYGFGQVTKKPATTTRSATATPAADPALVVTDLDASSTYLFHTVAFFDTTANADFKLVMSFAGASSVRCVRKSVAAGATAFTVSSDLTAGSSSPTMSITGTGTNGGMVDVYCIVAFGSSTPQAAFTWSQDTSDAGNTSVLAGSFIEFIKVTGA